MPVLLTSADAHPETAVKITKRLSTIACGHSFGVGWEEKEGGGMGGFLTHTKGHALRCVY